MKKQIILLSGLLALCACNNDLIIPGPDPAPVPNPAPVPQRKDIPLTETEKLMVQRNNDFAYRLFGRINDSCPKDSNVLISPLSVGYALSMLSNGADGETWKEIQKLLGYGECSEEEINGFNRKMLYCSARLDPETSVTTANSIWLRQGMTVFPEFKKINEICYDAETNLVDFSDPWTFDRINRWVSVETDGRIPSILDEVNPDATLYLLNVLSFRGRWSTPFEKSATGEGVFTNADGSTSAVPMMSRRFNTVCMAGDTYTTLVLPYGNASYSMYILLPSPGETPASVIAGFTEQSWAKMYKNRTAYEVHLKLPRFGMTYQAELKDILDVLGMPSAFDPSKADFSRLSRQPVFITDVFQKSRIDVDEEGTKAESATVVEASYASPGPPPELPELDFFVDRPFVFMIREISTGAIFFIGEMNRL